MRNTDSVLMRRIALGHAAMLGGFALLTLLLLSLHLEGLHWHDPGRDRWLDAALVSAAWLGLVSWLRWRRPRGPTVVADVTAGTLPALSSTNAAVSAAALVPVASQLRVVYASQTGFAEQLAQQTLQSLQLADVPAQLQGMDGLSLADLQRGHGQRVLFVVSTTGDGEPPDMAMGFHRLLMQQPAALAGLQYGLLALGDTDYEDFCGFGRQLHRWLQASGAQALFDPVEVDSEDEASLRHWQHHLAKLSGVSDLPDWQAPKYQRWQLAERKLLNPGSVGAACFHLALTPLQGGVDWQAGDLVEIGPCHGAAQVALWLAAHALDGSAMVAYGRQRLPLGELLACCRLPDEDEVEGLDETALAEVLQRLPHREYSIASIATDGAIHLLVRVMHGPNGRLGLGSGWLTTHAPLGAEIALRVRRNANFHAPRDARPLILIGNGTGMAALRALLKERVAAGQHRNWLLFGERQQAHDFHYGSEIRAWLAQGQLERADFAWSRDQPERVYVQQRLREAAGELRRWVGEGAAIYVCGSLDGMAPAVDEALGEVLGAAQLEQWREQGRYRRDVY